MKKIIVLFLMALLTAVTLSARPTGLRLGGGYAMDFYYSNVDGSSNIGGGFNLDNKIYYGAFFDIGYDWNITENHALVTGARLTALLNIRFNKNNYVKSETDYALSGMASDRLYVDIPVLYQYSFNVNPSVQLFFNAGPTLNFYLLNNSYFADTYKKAGSGSSDFQSANWFKDNLVTKWTQEPLYNQVGLSLGASFGVYFHHVKIYAGYDHSVTSFIKTKFTDNQLSTYGQLRFGAAYVF